MSTDPARMRALREAQSAAIENIRLAAVAAAALLMEPTPAPYAYDTVRELRGLCATLADLVRAVDTGIRGGAEDWVPESQADPAASLDALQRHIEAATSQLDDVEHGGLARVQQTLAPFGSRVSHDANQA